MTFFREDKLDSKDENVQCQMMIYPSDHRNDDQLKNYFLRILLIDNDGETIEEKVNLKTLIDRSDSFFKIYLHHSTEPTKIQLKLLSHDEDEDEELRWKIERVKINVVAFSFLIVEFLDRISRQNDGNRGEISFERFG